MGSKLSDMYFAITSTFKLGGNYYNLNSSTHTLEFSLAMGLQQGEPKYED